MRVKLLNELNPMKILAAQNIFSRVPCFFKYPHQLDSKSIEKLQISYTSESKQFQYAKKEYAELEKTKWLPIFKIPHHTPLYPSYRNIEMIDPLLVQTGNLILHLPRVRLTPMIEKIPLWRSDVLLPTVNGQAPAMQAGGGRPLIWRHRSMKKHWRKKHFKRDIVIYRKRERRRKVAAEKVFRDRLVSMIHEAEDFDAKKYVEDFLSKVPLKKKDDEILPISMLVNEFSEKTTMDTIKSQRKQTKHWTELISVEQLFGLPPSNRIEKDAGKVNEEEWQEILKMRRKYDEAFRKRSNAKKNEVKED